MPSAELNRKQTAQALGVAPRAIDRLIRDADCPLRPGRKRGRLLHWPAAQVAATRAWLAARDTAPSSARESAAPTLAQRLAAFPMPRDPEPREPEPVAALGPSVEPTRHGPPFPVAPPSARPAFDPARFDPMLLAPLCAMMNPFWWIGLAAGASDA